jgi:HK97 family phage portal protein
MATNPLRAVRDFLTGEDLKVRLPPAPAQGAPAGAPEQKTIMYVFSPGSYDGTPAALASTLGGLWGGTGNLDWNSAVYSCISAIANSFQEAPLRVWRLRRDGSEAFDDAHPLMDLLDDPHPSLSQPEINYWLEYAKQVHGNAYLRKIRDTVGRPVQLWPVSPAKLSPVTTASDAQRGVFISFYRLDLGDGKFEDIPPADVLHFRMGVDDRDHRLGLSPLRHLSREVSSDEEATKFSDSLLKNYAVPGAVVQIPAGVVMTEDEATELKARLQNAYGNGNQGSFGVLTAGATLQKVGLSPQELDLKAAHEFPESRIAAVFGTPAMVVGLGIGLQRSTFSNYKEAREALFEQTIAPLWRADARTFMKQLLRPDFEPTDRSVRLKYDLNGVRALQEDQNQIYARLSVAVEKGWVKRNEARAEVGFDPVPGWDAEDEQTAAAAAAALADAMPAPALPPPGGGAPPNGAPPANGAPRRLPPSAAGKKALGLGAIPGLLDTLHDLTTPAVAADLDALFREQHQRVSERLRDGRA